MIAIKDFKMPVDCQSCFARFGSWCRLDLDERMVVPALPEESVNGFKPDWCPLVDVPDMNVGKCSEIPNDSTDCIRRQDAIDKFASIVPYAIDDEYTHGYMDGLRDGYDVILELPSVQPELTEKVEDILTYLDTELHPIVSPEHWNVYSELYDMIKALSSAEPERKKGEWFLTDTMYACNQCHSVFYETSPFCPNCGAEMKGEE